MNTTQHPNPRASARETRAELLTALDQRLADILALWLQAKRSHWNVRGPGFFALHEHFDKVAAELAGLADEIAERIAQLGGVAGGTVRLPVGDADVGLGDGDRHVRALAESLRRFGTAAHAAITQAEECRDPVTADLLTDALATAEKLRWLLESHATPKGTPAGGPA